MRRFALRRSGVSGPTKVQGSDPPLGLPGGGGSCLDRLGCRFPHGLDMGRQLGSTNQYKVVHARNGVLGVCLDTWGI
jgi:hypothetical protein